MPLPDANGNAELLFSDGRLSGPITKKVNINAKDAVVKVPAADASLSLSINRVTGQFTGAVKHTDGTAPAYMGAIYQKGPAAGGYGFFLTTTPKVRTYDGESGAVSLTVEP